jgi:hypothetical protein
MVVNRNATRSSDAGAHSDVGWRMAWCRRGHNADERGERDVALSDSDATNAMDRGATLTLGSADVESI